MKNLKLKRVEILDDALLFENGKHIEMYVFVDEKLESDSEKIIGAIQNFDSFILAFQIWTMLDEETDDELNFNESLIENILSDMRSDKKEISNPELYQKIKKCILKLYENENIVQINNVLLYLDDFDGKDYDGNLNFYDKHRILKEVYILDIYLSYDIKELDLSSFNYDQILEIYEGLKNDVDVNVYAKPKYNDDQMYEIRIGLEEGLDVSWYAEPEFNEDQMEEIRLGLEDDVDVNVYAKPEFNRWQMEEIRLGLERGLDVSVYADFHLNSDEMREIREKLEKEKALIKSAFSNTYMKLHNSQTFV